MGTLSTKGVLLDGSNEHIVIGNVTQLDFDYTSPFSVSAWVVRTATGTHSLVSKMLGASTYQGWSLSADSSNRFYLELYSNFSGGNRLAVATTSGFPLGPYYHVVATYSGSSTAAGVNLYVNGAAVAMTTLFDALSATTLNTASAYIGRRTDGLYWPGLIDEVAVYNKELSGAEVTTIFNAFDPPDLTSVGPTGNLVGYWPIGDGDTYPTATDASITGGAVWPTITDASGGGSTGTAVNMETTDVIVDSPGGTFSKRSMLFDGTNEYVEIGDVVPLQFERTNTISVSAWVKTSTGTPQMVVGKQGTGTANRGWGLAIDTGLLPHFSLYNDEGGGNAMAVKTSAAITSGAWTHVVATYDGSSTAAGVTLYVNGSPVATTTVYDSLSATILSSATAQIARRNNVSFPNYFNGTLGEIAVYNKQMTSGEVTTVYNGGVPPDLASVGPTGNLVGWWRMGNLLLNNGTYTNTEATDIVFIGGGPQPITGPGFSFGLAGAGSLLAPAGVGASEPFPSGSAAVNYFKMRALADPGPGYLTWVAAGSPDFTGTGAGGPIQAGTAVVADHWSS